MSIPWRIQPKTWRDKFYDLVLLFSSLMTSYLECFHLRLMDRINDLIRRVLQLEASLGVWKSSWLTGAYPHTVKTCECRPRKPLSCICLGLQLKFSSVDFALLRLESLSLQLMISFVLHRLLAYSGRRSTCLSRHLSARSTDIACRMEAILACHLFDQATNGPSGISEALCRSIMPTLALREYRVTDMIESNEDLR